MTRRVPARVVNVGRWIRRQSEGPFRRISPLIYPVVVGTQLGVARQIDRLGHKPPSRDEAAELSSRVTMIVKTFERPATVRRLIRTARRVFEGRIIVADDSLVPLTDLGDGVEIIPLPFNVGLSAGRNAALDRVETEYVFVTDDDTVFTQASDIVAMMEYLDDNTEVDLIAIQLVNLPWWYALDNTAQALYPGAAPPLRQPGELIGGAMVVPKTENVFLARTASVKAIRWDDDLRLVEHKDFFSRASGRLVCVQADGVRAYHVRTPYNAFYMKHRWDVMPSFAIANRKWAQRSPAIHDRESVQLVASSEPFVEEVTGDAADGV